MASEDICYEPAYEVDYLAVVRPDHPLASRQTLSMRRLIEHPLVVGHENTNARRLFDHVLHREGFLGDAQIVVETDNSAFTIACVRAGLGVGILAGKLNGDLTRDLVRLPLQRHLGRARLVFIWAKNRHMARATKTLMTLIRELGDADEN